MTANHRDRARRSQSSGLKASTHKAFHPSAPGLSMP